MPELERDTDNGGKATDVRPANNTTSLHVGLKLHTRLMITNTQALWGKSGQSRASDVTTVPSAYRNTVMLF
jgi:hypothetical protein